MLNLKAIIGSTRPARVSEKLVPWIKSRLAQQKEWNVEFLDLRDYPLPFYDQPISPSQVQNGEYGSEAARVWAAKIKEGDAYLIITPEYNHGYPAVLKNALDSVYAEWNNKPIAFISYGSAMGARAVEALRLVAVELQMAPIRQGLHISSFWTLPEENGFFKEEALESYNQPFERQLAQLTWWAEALKAARQP